jgi:hypothetical protein
MLQLLSRTAAVAGARQGLQQLLTGTTARAMARAIERLRRLTMRRLLWCEPGAKQLDDLVDRRVERVRLVDPRQRLLRFFAASVGQDSFDG